MTEIFDYIIVGSGSAGSVLADRLTASGKHRVLLLEAGGTDWRFYVQMPLGYGKTFYDKSVNWMYKAEPDPGLNGQSDFYPRGKLLGGSSSINAMVYIRGHRQDYEDWRAAGNVGWGWDEVLATYRKIEDYAAGDPDLRGRGGPLTITDLGSQAHPLCKPYLEAAEKAGLPFTPDFNGKSQEGAGLYQFTIKGGIRNSAARAFLHPAMKRKNLLVEPHAQAPKILFEGKRAVGVAYVQRGRKRDAKGREVIRGFIVEKGDVGFSAPEIGEKLFISPKTVDTYKQRMQDKLGLSHRHEYVQLALRLGLLTPEA